MARWCDAQYAHGLQRDLLKLKNFPSSRGCTRIILELKVNILFKKASPATRAQTAGGATRYANQGPGPRGTTGNKLIFYFFLSFVEGEQPG